MVRFVEAKKVKRRGTPQAPTGSPAMALFRKVDFPQTIGTNSGAGLAASFKAGKSAAPRVEPIHSRAHPVAWRRIPLIPVIPTPLRPTFGVDGVTRGDGVALGVGEALGVGGTAGADVPCGAGAGGSGVQAAKAAAATARGTVRNVLRSMCTPWNCGEIRPESRGARSALRERRFRQPASLPAEHSLFHEMPLLFDVSSEVRRLCERLSRQ